MQYYELLLLKMIGNNDTGDMKLLWLSMIIANIGNDNMKSKNNDT